MSSKPLPASTWGEVKAPQPAAVPPPAPANPPDFPTDPVTWLRGVLRIIAERISDPSPEHPAEECLRFAQDLARAALRQPPTGPIQVGELEINPEDVEEAVVEYQRGQYQTVEEILRELQGHDS